MLGVSANNSEFEKTCIRKWRITDLEQKQTVDERWLCCRSHVVSVEASANLIKEVEGMFVVLQFISAQLSPATPP